MEPEFEPTSFFQCTMHCHLITVNTICDDDVDTIISFWEQPGYVAPFRLSLARYFKRLWNAITGKKTHMYEIILNPDDVERLACTFEKRAAELRNIPKEA